jgi:hypothetical protein
MQQSDPAWQNAFEAVNDILNTTYKLNALVLLRRYVHHLKRMEFDRHFRRHVGKAEKLEREAGKRVPAFMEVCDQINASLAHLVRLRTRPVHWAVLVLAYVALSVWPATIKLAINSLRSGIKSWRNGIKGGVKIASQLLHGVRAPEHSDWRGLRPC